MLVKMSRVAVVGLKKERADALSYLHDLGIFEKIFFVADLMGLDLVPPVLQADVDQFGFVRL